MKKTFHFTNSLRKGLQTLVSMKIENCYFLIRVCIPVYHCQLRVNIVPLHIKCDNLTTAKFSLPSLSFVLTLTYILHLCMNKPHNAMIHFGLTHSLSFKKLKKSIRSLLYLLKCDSFLSGDTSFFWYHVPSSWKSRCPCDFQLLFIWMWFYFTSKC